MITAVLFALVFLATMAYGPLGALSWSNCFLSVSDTAAFPSHCNSATGWIGGFAPFIATAVVIATGSIFGGLWYTVVIAGLTAVVGALLLLETRGRDINA